MKTSILLCLLLAACGGGNGGYPLAPGNTPITTFPYPMGIVPASHVSPYASNLTNPVTQAVEIFNAPPTRGEMLILTDPVMLLGVSGTVQGALSRTALVQPVFLAYDPVTKLISPTAAADIATFIAEFTAAAGAPPYSVLIMDEMLWDGNPNPSPSEITAMANSMQQLVSLWETAAAPRGIGLTVSIFPGLLINPATSPQVLPLLTRSGSIIFKSTIPFEPTGIAPGPPAGGALAWLATIPEQALSGFCMVPRTGRTDYDLMMCAPALIPLRPPFGTGPVLGLSYPAKLATANVNNPAALTQLESTWTDLHAVMSSWTHNGQIFMTPWLDGFNWAPGFASGQSFMTPVMIEELKAALTIELTGCWDC